MKGKAAKRPFDEVLSFREKGILDKASRAYHRVTHPLDWLPDYLHDRMGCLEYQLAKSTKKTRHGNTHPLVRGEEPPYSRIHQLANMIPAAIPT